MIREEDTIGKDRTDAQSGVGPVLSHGQESADPFDTGSSDSAGTGLEILDPRIVDWVRSLGWDELRPIQRDALEPILSGTTDVILSAATASGFFHLPEKPLPQEAGRTLFLPSEVSPCCKRMTH